MLSVKNKNLEPNSKKQLENDTVAIVRTVTRSHLSIARNRRIVVYIESNDFQAQ